MIGLGSRERQYSDKLQKLCLVTELLPFVVKASIIGYMTSGTRDRTALKSPYNACRKLGNGELEVVYNNEGGLG